MAFTLPNEKGRMHASCITRNTTCGTDMKAVQVGIMHPLLGSFADSVLFLLLSLPLSPLNRFLSFHSISLTSCLSRLLSINISLTCCLHAYTLRCKYAPAQPSTNGHMPDNSTHPDDRRHEHGRCKQADQRCRDVVRESRADGRRDTQKGRAAQLRRLAETFGHEHDDAVDSRRDYDDDVLDHGAEHAVGGAEVFEAEDVPNRPGKQKRGAVDGWVGNVTGIVGITHTLLKRAWVGCGNGRARLKEMCHLTPIRRGTLPPHLHLHNPITTIHYPPSTITTLRQRWQAMVTCTSNTDAH